MRAPSACPARAGKGAATDHKRRPGDVLTRRSGVALPVDIESFRRAVLGWFDARGRSLPFRGTTDPYLVLVSEILLQQTQISRGGPAWVTFTRRFPTVQSLAAATPADVLRAWQGLGYNRRAVNLQRAARIIVNEMGGAFPRDVAGLERLPGIGPYTARAVASIAYRIPTGAVDTNVRRVLGRVLAGDPAGFRPAELQAAADHLVDSNRPDDWTHALMDIGSMLCRPARPLCTACPLESMCRYAAGERPAAAPPGRAASTQPSGAGPASGGFQQRVPARDFRQTTRWLRGRILDRLRDAPGDAWTTFSEPIGDHDSNAVRSSLRALQRDGLLELHDPKAGPPDGSPAGEPARDPRARLPIT
jgi:A/G-specific adenine glycosylase